MTWHEDHQQARSSCLTPLTGSWSICTIYVQATRGLAANGFTFCNTHACNPQRMDGQPAIGTEPRV